MIYVIFTTGKAYDKNYLQQQDQGTEQQAAVCQQQEGLGTPSPPATEPQRRSERGAGAVPKKIRERLKNCSLNRLAQGRLRKTKIKK